MINEVLKGITDALYAAFGDNYEIHTEASMQDMEEPAFFVRCINPDVPRGLTGRRKATLLFIVQYFPESDEPKKEINTVYERLSECLDLIEADLLSALLEPGKSYTLEEVDKKMEKYMKGAVR